jgi:uncharacterized membrane protein YcaP (DUF421 family)
MWFSSWTEVARVAAFTVIGYASVLTLVRLAGKRTIAKKNTSDFIITVAIGSSVATMILSETTSLAEGVAALATLVLLQFVVVLLSTRWDTPRRAIEGKATLLVYDGRLLADRMRHEEVNASEVYQSIRNAGIGRLEDVLAVVLEVDGTFSVIAHGQEPATALDDVEGTPVRSP